MNSGQGEAGIGVPVQCCTECNTLDGCTKDVLLFPFSVKQQYIAKHIQYITPNVRAPRVQFLACYKIDVRLILMILL